MQIYKSLKKKQNLFKKLLSLYWVAFIPPTAKLMSGLSLPFRKMNEHVFCIAFIVSQLFFRQIIQHMIDLSIFTTLYLSCLRLNI